MVRFEDHAHPHTTISTDWNILATVQVEDFAMAIQESHVPDAH